jgi:predicted ATPase/DNA-binding SARP family transcriptional activator
VAGLDADDGVCELVEERAFGERDVPADEDEPPVGSTSEEPLRLHAVDETDLELAAASSTSCSSAARTTTAASRRTSGVTSPVSVTCPSPADRCGAGAPRADMVPIAISRPVSPVAAAARKWRLMVVTLGRAAAQLVSGRSATADRRVTSGRAGRQADASVREGEPPMAVDVRMLGGLEVRVGGSVVSLGGPQAQVVFALLASDAGRTVPNAQLIDELWPTDPPRDPIGTIQTHVGTIRRGLGSERQRLTTREGGYVLDLAVDELDAARFVALTREGRDLLTADAARAQARLEAALEEWRGEPLVGLATRAACLQAEATRLSELRLGVVEDLAELRLRQGRHAEVVADLERLLADHPFRERSVGLLLRALAAAGRQTDALTRYLEHRRRLTDEFGIEPSVELQHLYVELLRADDGRSPAGPPLPLPSGGEDPSAGRLPSFHTRWYGRERESERLVGVLGRERLITITGAGGAGKTRLAVELARRVRSEFRGGVSFVDLAPILDAALVPRAAAGALGIDLGSGGTATHDILVQALAEERVLLVLDNCEHLLDACADLVSRLREDCAGVTVLATSRAPLGLDGEQRWPIGPLALPAGDLVDESASMQLLVDRTRAVRRGFGITDDNRDALVSICHHLDGLPLAIELVAAQLAHLSPVETAGRLAEHATTLLRGQRRIPRHRTLEATIRWSYDLLSGPQRALLRRLSVFVGGATLGSITAVAGDGRDELAVLELLGSLVTASLVTVDEADGVTRYDLLETIRQFAADRLRAAGEEASARGAHLDHYLVGLESVTWDQRMFSLGKAALMLDVEFSNLGAAFRTAIARGDRDRAARLAVGAPALIIANQHWDAFDRWLTELWGVPPADLSLPERVARAASPEHLVHHFWIEAWRLPLAAEQIRATMGILRAGAQQLAPGDPARLFAEHTVLVGSLLFDGADLDEGLVRFREQADGAHEADAPLLQAAIVGNAALFLLYAGRYAEAVVTLRSSEVADVAEHYGLPLTVLAVAEHLAGDHAAAVDIFQRDVESPHPHPAARPLALLFLAIAIAGSGDLDAARDLIRRAREAHDRLRWRHPLGINDIIVALGACAVVEGRTDVAARLLAAAGPPTAGFKPLAAIHLHYARLAGPPTSDGGGAPGTIDAARLEDLVDAELVRWAREPASGEATVVAPPSRPALEV